MKKFIFGGVIGFVGGLAVIPATYAWLCKRNRQFVEPLKSAISVLFFGYDFGYERWRRHSYANYSSYRDHFRYTKEDEKCSYSQQD